MHADNYLQEDPTRHGFRCVQQALDGSAWLETSLICTSTGNVDGLRVLTSVAMESDCQFWLHVSCSRTNQLPSYDDLKRVKAVFIGDDRKAIEVHPPRREHVNINPFVRHLWCCLTDNPFPDFTKGGGTI